MHWLVFLFVFYQRHSVTKWQTPGEDWCAPQQLYLKMIFWGLIYLHCALRADYETQPVHNETLLHKQWISSKKSRAGEQEKKKKKIQPSIRRVIESTLCRGAAEYRTVQGSLLNPRQDIHYSHKLPSQQNRRAGFTEREQPSLISCSKPYFPAWYGNPFPPSTPQPLFFHCSGRFLPSMAARKHAVSGH